MLEFIHIENMREFIRELQGQWFMHPDCPSNSRALQQGRSTSDHLFICCPFHAEFTPSCSVMTDFPYGFHCFGCGEKGSIGKLVAHVCQLRNEVEGYRWILKSYISNTESRPPIPIEQILDGGGKRREALPEEILTPYKNKIHTYMKNRGFSVRTLLKYEVGYDESTDSIIFPVRATDGTLRFIQKRSVTYKKFHNDRGVYKKDILYGLCYLRGRTDEVYITESITDTLSCYEAGFPAVALLGSHFYPEQAVELLKVGIRKLHIFTDQDEAGRRAREEIIQTTYPFHIYVVKYPDNSKDANELLQKGKLKDITSYSLEEMILIGGES